MDASFQAGSNDTISSHVRHWRPDISPPFHGGVHISLHLRHHMRLFTLTPTCGGKGGDQSDCRKKEGGQGAAGERVKGDTFVPLILRLRGINFSFIQRLSGIGFALFLYYPIRLILSKAKVDSSYMYTQYKLKSIPLSLSILLVDSTYTQCKLNKC